MTDGLVLDSLCVTLDGRRVVDLSARIAPGEVLTVMAPSGAGKSTLLAAITGTLEPAFRQSGRILLDGRDLTGVPTRVRQIGLMFQDALLFPHLSVGGNLAFALPARHRDRAARIAAALNEAGLPGFADRDPATLSGGERARVALMRTFLPNRAPCCWMNLSRAWMPTCAAARAISYCRPHGRMACR